MLRKFLVGLVALFSFGVAAKALSTVEIVAQAKPCVVTIQVWNSANPKKPVSSGTGFFIADDKIVTDAHVVNGDYDRIMVTSLSGEQIYVEGKALYDNGAAEVDLAILKVQNAGTHAHLEFAASLPQEGENVTVIGNPQGLTGTVSTGIVSAVRKNGEIIQFTAPVSNGSSGGPVLDDDGKVIGIADFILTPRGNEIAQNLNFAHGVPVMQLALNNSSSATVYYNSAQEQQAEQNIPGHQTLKPLDEPNADERNLPVPKQFGTTRHSGDYDLVQVLDKEAIFAIALPVYGYLSASANGTPTNRFFMGKLGKFFDLNNVTYDQAKANDEAYFKKWPNRVNSIDSKNIVVEKVNWSGSTCYFVTMPYSWSVRNGNKSQNGKAVAVAYVMPGHHTGNGKSDYFITSIWNDGKQ